MSDDQVGGFAGEPTPDDEFDTVVLDESFIRAGIHEPPARTRIAIARGTQQRIERVGRQRRTESVTGVRTGRRRPVRAFTRLLVVVVVAASAAVVFWVMFRDLSFVALG